MSRRRRLGWWLLDYAYAVRRQGTSLWHRHPPSAYAHGDTARPAVGRPAVVLLPGVYERWIFLAPAADRLHAAGYRILTVPELGRNHRDIPASAALVADALRRRCAEHGVTQVILLAHSKGGLIGKRLMLDAGAPPGEPTPTPLAGSAGGRSPIPAGATGSAGGGPVILGLVAVATPFPGSSYARFLPSRTLRHFSPTNAVLRSLQGLTLMDAKITSIYPAFDPHLPQGSVLPGAVNVAVPDVGHFRCLGRPATLAAIDAAVARLAEGADNAG